MSEVNRALIRLYRLGVDHRDMKILSTKATHSIHRYFITLAIDSPDTYTTLDELSHLLKTPYSTTYRCINILAKHSLVESRKGKPQRKNELHGAGGSGKREWRARL